MKINIKGLNRLLVESALIVFSVLFALFINRYAESLKMEQQKQIALERIVQEMKSNRDIMSSAIKTHQIALANLRSAATKESDSLRYYLANRGYFDDKVLELLLNGGTFLPEIPKSTSWNAAITTGIIAEFDYEIVTTLTRVYDFQGLITEEILTSILDIIYTSVDEKEIRTINALSVQIRELIELEQIVIAEIDETLKVLYPDTEEEEQ